MCMKMGVAVGVCVCLMCILCIYILLVHTWNSSLNAAQASEGTHSARKRQNLSWYSM